MRVGRAGAACFCFGEKDKQYERLGFSCGPATTMVSFFDYYLSLSGATMIDSGTHNV
jgi:hypothetical protein